MKNRLLTLSAIAILSTTGLKAQNDSVRQKKEVIIEKRLNDRNPDKTVIVIDGNKITVNGEEVEGLQNLRGKLKGMGEFNFNDMEALRPQMQEMFRNFGPQMQNNLREFRINTRSNKAMLGVNVEKDEKGAKITEVVKESAAEKAGLKAEDIITSINSEKIADGDALVQTIGKYKPEEVVDVTVLRSGKEKKLKATLGKNENVNERTFNWNSDMNLPAVPGAPDAPRSFNFNFDNNLRGLSADRPKFGFGIKDNENGDGAVVTNIKEETSASKAGLKENDIITEAAGSTVKNVDDLKRLLAENRDKSEINIKVLRSGKTQNFTLKVPKKIKTAEL